MRGHTRPLTCCTHDCADANGCRTGGMVCADCGLYFCIEDVSNYEGVILCDDCRSDREQEEGDDL